MSTALGGTIKAAGNFWFSPTTIICSMKRDSLNLFSIACGTMYFPPDVLKISFLRSVIKKFLKHRAENTLIEGVKVKLAEDGEILVKGPNVMMGYYNLPDKTAEVIDAQGWFHTGDIGTWVDEQFLKITDRKKEIFKTSGGKYIVPQAMENKFKESRFIEQMMVVGENQKFPAALIVPPKAVLIDWARAHNVNADLPYGELLRTPEIVDLFQKEVDKYNELYGSWEKIKKFALLENEFAIDTGELTPTLKLKRKIIIEKYQSLLDGFYQGEE